MGYTVISHPPITALDRRHPIYTQFTVKPTGFRLNIIKANVRRAPTMWVRLPRRGQGEQDTTYEHANGSPFFRWGSDVQASRDAPHHRIHTAPPIPCVKKHSSRLSSLGIARASRTQHSAHSHAARYTRHSYVELVIDPRRYLLGSVCDPR